MVTRLKIMNNKFHGYLSVKDAICSSYNIPAVKIMSYTTIDKSKKYAEKCGIEFSPNDDNYSIALGGMTYGTDLCSLTSAYTTLPTMEIMLNQNL